jgi:cupin 2 domain-containing protein
VDEQRSGPPVRGRLIPGRAAPAHGERTLPLAAGDGFTVEQILSGELDAPLDYAQDHDEWVVVVDGAAALELDGVVHELGRGDWVLLSAGVPHRLLRTERGTSWLAVRSVRARREGHDRAS